MKSEIVVARYDEPIEWLLPLADRVTIYNKGPPLEPSLQSRFARVIDLPNVGRESHTYLTHILHTLSANPESQAHITAFIQARIHDHIPKNTTPIDFIKRILSEATQMPPRSAPSPQPIASVYVINTRILPIL